MRQIMQRCAPVLSMLAIGAGLAQEILAEQPIDPVLVVPAAKSAQQSLEQSYSIVSVAQSKGRRAVLLGSRAAPSVVIVGEGVGTREIRLQETFDMVALDEDHNLHLRYANQLGSDKTKIKLIRSNDGGTQEFYVNEAKAVPVTGDRQIVWRTRDSLVRPGYPNIRSSVKSVPDPNDRERQRRFIFGLPGGRYATFGSLTEIIAVFRTDGEILSEISADLDAAYAQLGAKIPPRSDPATGRSRVLWASGSSDGYLYVCLSDVPANGPASLARYRT